MAAGPEVRLYRDGLDEYGKVLRRVLRSGRRPDRPFSPHPPEALRT